MIIPVKTGNHELGVGFENIGASGRPVTTDYFKLPRFKFSSGAAVRYTKSHILMYILHATASSIGYRAMGFSCILQICLLALECPID